MTMIRIISFFKLLSINDIKDYWGFHIKNMKFIIMLDNIVNKDV